jgi:hypothetical protein
VGDSVVVDGADNLQPGAKVAVASPAGVADHAGSHGHDASRKGK